jgi:ankyrin repeat protein
LIHAHINGNWDFSYGINFLIENGYVALINQQDMDGETPLHHAAKVFMIGYCRHKIILKLILQPTMLHNVRNDKGRTPLHTACYHGYALMVQELVENKNTDNDMIDYGGENALHHTIQGYINCPRYSSNYTTNVHYILTKNPFLVIKKNNYNESAYDYAMKLKQITHGRQMLQMNGKSRRYRSMELNSEFSSNLVNNLDFYHIKARFCMFKYFMESDINHC